MRDAMSRLGGDPKKINPLCPVDLVIDHSVQVDAAGILAKNAVEKGLSTKPYIKKSLSPGSHVVTEYYKIAGVDKYMD